MENLAFTLDHHVQRRPDKVVIVDGDRSVTNSELFDEVNALAAGLSEMGVGLGDIVALLMYNCTEFLESIYATNRLGAAVLPLNYRLAPEEWSYILGHSGASVVVVDEEFEQPLRAVLDEVPAVRHIISGGARAATSRAVGVHLMDEVIERHRGARVPCVDVPGETMQRLMYTSGTTSRPKGVVISHRNVMYKDLGLILNMGWTDEDVSLVCGPLYHVGGLDLGGLTVLHAGGGVVLQRKFDAAALVGLIEGRRPTTTWLAPAMVNSLLQVPEVAEADLSSVQSIISGGEKMPEARLQEVLRLFPDVWFVDAYGLTETVAGDTTMTREHMRRKLGSVGRPVPHLQLRVVDDSGLDIPVGQSGEIVLRGPKVFSGYWKDDEASARSIRDGWFYTGDVGRLDDEGFVYIDDRKKDMIVSGGENIATPEVERVLYEHPAVIEAAVIGVPNERWGEVPAAYVVIQEGESITEEALLDFCRERLARFKVPKHVLLIDELPRTPSGKVLKRHLRTHAEEAR